MCLGIEIHKKSLGKTDKKSSKYWCDSKHSFMVKCTACRVIYAVVGVEDLEIAPKCHYCRFGGKNRHPARLRL